MWPLKALKGKLSREKISSSFDIVQGGRVVRGRGVIPKSKLFRVQRFKAVLSMSTDEQIFTLDDFPKPNYQ